MKFAGLPGAQELDPQFVPAQVRRDEKALPGVTYTTFGGSSPTLVKLFIRTYTVTKHPPFFVKASESMPFFENKAFAETTRGKGDVMVTDESAKLPWLGAKHFSNPLHHGEVLWTATVINQVKLLVEHTGKPAGK